MSLRARSRAWKWKITLGACASLVATRVRGSTESSLTYIIVATAAIGLSHIFYFVLWTHVFVQDYESWRLRMACTLLLVGLCVYRVIEPANTPGYVAYYHFTVICCGPAFFTYMFLMNHETLVWFGSTICGLQLLSLIVDAPVLLAWSIVGAAMAVLAYALGPASSASVMISGEQWVIFLFSLLTAVVFNMKSRWVRSSSVRAARLAVGYIVHEVSTPLACVNVTTQWMRARLEALPDTQLGDAARAELGDAVADLQASSLEMADTMTGFAAMTGSAASGAGQPRTSVGLCVEEAVRLARLRFGQQVDITVTLDPHARVDIPASLLTRVVYNLLVNALKSITSAGDGAVAIRGRQNRSHYVLAIRDTGLGIPAPLRMEIFNPFFTWSSTGRTTGTGMGLHFCRAALEGRGGRLRCRSALGVYAEFLLQLPVTAVPV